MVIANMTSARNLAKESHPKNRIGYHNARGYPKCDKFIIKLGTTEMGFDFNEADMLFNP